MNSFRARILVLWALLAGVCGVLLFVTWMANRAGPEAQIGAARRDTAGACESLQQSQRRLVASGAIHDAALLGVVTDLSLRDAVGIEGGIWDAQQGFVAYAFPTHEAASPKIDMPLAERPAIEALVQRVSASQPAVSDLQRGRRETGVLAACALPQGQVAWTFTRVASAEAHAIQQVAAIAVVALGLVLLAGIGLLIGLRRWDGRLTELEKSLVERTSLEQSVPLTGERDLDRLVLAFNASARHAIALGEDARRLAHQLAHAERMGAVGRLAAGMAHEIRNPLGSMRLRSENALATSGEAALERRDSALRSVLKAVEKLESLVGSLLALTRPIRPQWASTVVEPWLRDIARGRAEEAAARDIRLDVCCAEDLRAEFDPEALGRALDNLVQNALQHAPGSSVVRLAAAAEADGWHLTVGDAGPGVPPSIRAHLFEPFATGRADGTGLGLAIAREIVEAHGGRLTLAADDRQAGATFRMELPWRAS